MKNIETYTGILTNLERLPSSINGNPRYKAVIARACTIKGNEYNIHFQTSVDSSLGYILSNFEGKKVKVKIGLHYYKNTLASIELYNQKLVARGGRI